MKKPAELVLQQFEIGLQAELIEFGKRLNQLDVDLIILMARKAVGLLDLLQVIGVQIRGKEILSDRVLDLNPEYFKGKKVALVDDTLIKGTTLKTAKEKLI